MKIHGRLTLISGQPVMNTDVTSTTLWYAPYGGDTYPNLDNNLSWRNIRYTSSPTDTVGASLSCGTKWQAGSSYDVFGLATGIGTGPAWTASDDHNRNLIRYNGIKVNSNPMVIDTSESTSVSVLRYEATYLGSIHCSVTGQLSAHFSPGQDRKFEVWTAYYDNQVDILLQVVDVITPSGYWTPTNSYQQGFVPYNNDPLNRASIFTGDLTLVDITYHQNMFVNSQPAPSGGLARVGWNGGHAGHTEIFSSDTTHTAGSFSGTAQYITPAVGLNTTTMMCASANNPNTAMFSGSTDPYLESNQVLYARYRG